MTTEKSQKPRQAVVFFTHVFNPVVEERYRKLKTESSDHGQTFILAELGTDIPTQFADETHLFDFEKLRFSHLILGERVIPGNVHLVALDFFRTHPNFDLYWFIEYDVVFTGNWSTLFNTLSADHSDLLATHVRGFYQEPDWTWWSTLRIPNPTVSKDNWLRAFFPIYRISSAGFVALHERIQSGWAGHFEALIPTAVQQASLKISDIGGAGHWAPTERRHQFYSSRSSKSGTLNAGSFRYRPAHRRTPRKYTLYHPVKAASWTPSDNRANEYTAKGSVIRGLFFVNNLAAIVLWRGIVKLKRVSRIGSCKD